jgi:hypothetical protein
MAVQQRPYLSPSLFHKRRFRLGHLSMADNLDSSFLVDTEPSLASRLSVMDSSYMEVQYRACGSSVILADLDQIFTPRSM